MELTFRPNLASLSLTGMPCLEVAGVAAPVDQDELRGTAYTGFFAGVVGQQGQNF